MIISNQVCWYWRYLTELDQLWMPKALKLGWYLTFTPSIYETGVWKRHYLENVRSLHYLPPKVRNRETLRLLYSPSVTHVHQKGLQRIQC